MDGTYAGMAGLCLLGATVRSLYERQKAAGRVAPGNRAIFAVVFAGMMLLLGGWPLLGAHDPVRLALPDAARWLGLAAVAAGLGLAAGGLLSLRGVEDIDHLVTTGVFAWLRHPMYAGFVLWIAGWIVVYGAVISLGVGLVCAGCIVSWRGLEEVALEARYGDSYRAYRQRSSWRARVAAARGRTPRAEASAPGAGRSA